MSGGSRPFNGLGIEDAIKKWSDPTLPGHEPMFGLVNVLKTGTLLASGIKKHGPGDDYRRIIHPTLWETFLVYLDHDEMGWNGNTYLRPQFFEPTCIPRNITDIPDWVQQFVDEALGKNSGEFRHEADYSHVDFNGSSYAFGSLQARVIGKLHQASMTASPWLVGKQLLDDVGSSSQSLSQLFKSKPTWKKLIDSDGRGRYRLKAAKTDL